MFLLGDWLGLVTVSGLVLGTFGLGEWLRHRARWASERTRKLSHIGCGLMIFFFPYLFKSVHTVGVLSAAFLILLLSTRLLGFMQSIHAVRRKSVGVFLYPIAIYLTALLTWDRPAVFQASVSLLALADGLAALVGKRYGRHRYRLGNHVRTLEGSATVIAVSWVSTTLLLGLSQTVSFSEAALIGVLISVVICAVEALSLGGLDNLLIPLVSAVYLRAALVWTPQELAAQLAAAGVAALISGLCLRKGYLNLSGGIAAWLVGYTTLGVGGAAWFVPLLAFFMAVNWVGKLAQRLAGHRLPPNFERIEEKGSRRDFMQVFANAGVALLLTLAYAWAKAYAPAIAPTLFWAYLGSLCAASADTFASEVGILSRRPPILLWTLEPVSPGLSGGVSFLGYGAAAVGALVPVAALALVGSPHAFGASTFGVAIACGWIGSTVDSVVGATLQSKRQCAVCRRVLEKSEHCNEPTLHYRGLSYVNNDLVNAIGALTGAIVGACCAGRI